MKNLQLSSREIRNLCENLYMLVHSGINPADGFTILAEDEKGEYKELLTMLADYCDRGFSMSMALKESGAFPKYVCSMVEVGERTGRIDKALAALAEFYENRLRLERQVKTTLLYPALLLGVMLVVIVVLLTEVLPLFDRIYGQMGSTLTGVAGILLVLGQAIKRALPVICVLVGIAGIFIFAVAVSDRLKNRLVRGWRRVHGSRGIWEQLNVARTAQALAMGMSSGLNIEEALDMAAKLTDDIPEFRERLTSCTADIAAGDTLAQALGKHRLLPKSECRLLEAGTRGGLGDEAMRQIAERLLEDSEYALSQKISRIEPCIIIVTAGLVGLILLSVMMPLIQIMAALG